MRPDGQAVPDSTQGCLTDTAQESAEVKATRCTGVRQQSAGQQSRHVIGGGGEPRPRRLVFKPSTRRAYH